MTSHLSGPSGDSAPLRERVVRAGGWVTAGFLLDKLIATAQLVILARLLTPADFGLMAASAVVVLALLMLSEVGMDTALVSQRAVDQEDLAVAWTLGVGRGAVLAGLLWLTAEPIATFFRIEELAAFLRVHALALLLQGAHNPAMVLLLRNLDFRSRVQLDLTRRLIEAGTTLLLALWIRSAWALLLGQLAGFAVGTLLSYRVSPFRPWFSLYRPALRRFMNFGKQVNLTTACIFGVMSGGEFVVGRLLGAEGLGLYQIAMAIPMLIGVRAGITINQVCLPTYAMLQGDRAGLARAFALHMGLVGAILVPVCGGLALLAPAAVTILFGPQWMPVVEPLRILCLFGLCAGCSNVMTALHYGLNRPETQTRTWRVQFAVYALLIIPLTARFGVIGASEALTAAFLVGLFLQAVFTLNILGAEAWGAFATVGRTSLLVLGIAWTIWAVGSLASEVMSLWVFAICGVIGMSAYAWYVWCVEYPRLRDLWVRR